MLCRKRSRKWSRKPRGVLSIDFNTKPETETAAGVILLGVPPLGTLYPKSQRARGCSQQTGS